MSTCSEDLELSSLACRLLRKNWASVPVAVARLPGAVLCWSRADHFSDELASRIAVRTDANGTEIAWADRYGGAGIGGNGGSGRAALFSGMYLKGIGPTPLTGTTTHRYHTNGEVPLREAVGETIFAELFAHELPWGAVRSEAIIDTLSNIQPPFDPDHEGPVICERRVLLVREPPLRPAHFERAAHFTGPEALRGESDIRRIKQNKKMVLRGFGAQRIEASLREFWGRWCEQYAYLYVWRVAAGAPSPSNVALDGRLLDFGASASLPDWNATALFDGCPQIGHEFPRLLEFLRRFYAAQDDVDLTRSQPKDAYVAALGDECSRRYLRTVGVEMLRVAGLRRETVETAISVYRLNSRICDAAKIALRFYNRQFRLSVHASFEDFDFSDFWSDKTPSHLRALRAIGDKIAMDVRGEPIRQRMHARCIPRTRLLNHLFRPRLLEELPLPKNGRPVNRSRVEDVIRREFTKSRRDSRLEPANAYPCGYAAIGSSSFALFRNLEGDCYALEEPAHAYSIGTKITTPIVPLPFTQNGTIDGRPVDAVHYSCAPQ